MFARDYQGIRIGMFLEVATTLGVLSIAHMLSVGVIVSAAVVSLGGMLYLAKDPAHIQAYFIIRLDLS